MLKKTITLLICFTLAGCATTKTASRLENEPQIERGQPNVVVDFFGNIISIPSKVLLLNPKVESHSISPETEAAIKEYVADHSEEMKDTKIRLNQFAPVGEFKRLVTNKKVKWWWRVFPGVPVTLLSLGGRLFGGDNYNPYTDTINIYSDVPAITLHEAGHATDFAEHAEKGTAGVYAVGRILTPVTLYQEEQASEKAINYLKEKKNREGEKSAYKTLYPAYGTYVGSATGIPFANAAGAAVGHVLGLVPRHNRKLAYEAYDEAKWSEDGVVDIEADPLARSLITDHQKKEDLFKESFRNDQQNPQ